MAKSRSIGGIYAALTLKDGGFQKGLAAASKQLATFGKAAAVGLAAGVTAAGTALAYGAKQTMEMAGTLDDLSATTGLTIANAMKMRKAFELGGLGADAAGASIGKMQKAVYAAASGGNDPFTAIGLSAQALIKLAPEKQFEAIGDAIMRIENPAERTAKAMEIFGKSGAGLTNVFGQFKDAEQFLGKMPEVFEQYAKAMARADDIINELPNKGQQFFTGFTAGIIGSVLPGLEKVNDYDFTNLGQNLGTGLAIGLQAITDGTAWEIFEAQAEKAFLNIQQSPAFNGWAASINALWNILLDNSKNFFDEFDKYAALGKDINKDQIDQIDRKISELEGRVYKKFEFKQSQARAMNDAAPIANPIQNLAADALAASAKPAKQEVQKMDVNDFQRRGLYLEGAGALQSEEKKQTSILIEIRDGLRRMANTPGALTWP